GLLAALRRAEAVGAEVMQVFAQSPRQWRGPAHGDELLDAVRAAVDDSRVVQLLVCHAPYLINLATGDTDMRRRSEQALADNVAAAGRMGAAGLVLHVG